MAVLQKESTIRLRTMVLLRWCAIAGQLTTLAVAEQYFDISLPLGSCLLVVAFAMVVNLLAPVVFEDNKRLSHGEIVGTVMLDIVQLGCLLYFTGGLNNPFSIIIVAPIAVSATVLPLLPLIVLFAVAILLVSLLGYAHVPLRFGSGDILEIPPLLLLGNWVAIIITLSFLAFYARSVSRENQTMSRALTAMQLALAREQKLTDLGAVVAAAAHELGTPLSTIKLTSAELIDELEGQPELQEDACLIRDQSDRCRDILRSMGKAGKEDRQTQFAPLSEVMREAAEPHQDRGIKVIMTHGPGVEGTRAEPVMMRSPEIIHGLRNLIQNAVDFAETQIWIEAIWTEQRISVRIIDDGRGFPAQILNKIGEPFISSRGSELNERAMSVDERYEGMGLGLFIAKTLLERSAAELSFANAASRKFVNRKRSTQRCGAIVEVMWQRLGVEVPQDAQHTALGDNQPVKL